MVWLYENNWETKKSQHVQILTIIVLHWQCQFVVHCQFAYLWNSMASRRWRLRPREGSSVSPSSWSWSSSWTPTLSWRSGLKWMSSWWARLCPPWTGDQSNLKRAWFEIKCSRDPCRITTDICDVMHNPSMCHFPFHFFTRSMHRFKNTCYAFSSPVGMGCKQSLEGSSDHSP